MASRQFITYSYSTHFLTSAYNNIVIYFKLIIQKIAFKQKIFSHKKFQAYDKNSLLNQI